MLIVVIISPAPTVPDISPEETGHYLDREVSINLTVTESLGTKELILALPTQTSTPLEVEGTIYPISTETTEYQSGTYQLYQTREGIAVAAAETTTNMSENKTVKITGHLRRTHRGDRYLVIP